MEFSNNMIPNTKISQTILEYGKSLIPALPEHHTKAEFEAVISIVITAWNTAVMDNWNLNNSYESDVFSAISSLPKEAQLEFKRLIRRKKKKFGSDPRAVGNYWVREENGEFIFGCEARLNVENVPTSSTAH